MNKRENLLWKMVVTVSVIGIAYSAYRLYYSNDDYTSLMNSFESEEIGTDKELKEKVQKLEISLKEKQDFITAMRRFNQAFLVDSDNADIYYGYGSIYFNLGELEKAREQYDKGLKIDPKHSEILTDYGTTYMGDFYQNFDTDKKLAFQKLALAKDFLDKSYKIDDKNSNTVYKLSIVNMYLDNCKEAWKYLKKAKQMKNPNVTEAYEKELITKCGSS